MCAFQYIKHASTFGLRNLAPTAPNLLLTGGVCDIYSPDFQKVIFNLSQKWTNVFYVPGSRECGIFRSLQEDYAFMHICAAAYDNVHIMDNKVIWMRDNKITSAEDANLLLLGTPLWGAPRDNTSQSYHSENERNVRFLYLSMLVNVNINTIIMSHTAPVRNPNGHYYEFYPNHLHHLINNRDNIKYWFHGQKYYPDMSINQCRIIGS